MKVVKLMLILMAAVLITFGLSGIADAFHDGGVASCESCHTMHNSLRGAGMWTDGSGVQFKSGPTALLLGTDQSSACLNCHERDTTSSYASSTKGVTPAGTLPAQMTPGGDFSWIKTSSGTIGERLGHNIVAADNGYTADTTLTKAPGGTYPASSLHCSSCHDPHGKFRRLADGTIVNGESTSKPIYEAGSYPGNEPTADFAVGTYRLLGGIGYSPKSTPGYAFTNTVPAAMSPSSYNRTETSTDTRVSYGANMSEWCANCHASIHSDAVGSVVHKAGNGSDLGSAIAGNYNLYVKTGDLSGTSATSYTSLVPFELGTTDYTVIDDYAVNDGSKKDGPAGSANVLCLSCHRAHGSGWQSMIRYNLSSLMTELDGGGVPAYTPASRPQAEVVRSYYDRPVSAFATYQRPLCNKCHIRD